MKKVLLLLCAWIAVGAQAQILINEYQCSNMNTAMDNNGEYQDWFELFNTTSSPIDLTGYYLSDKITNPTKWQIPTGVTLPANGFVTVFANGKGVVSGSEIHTGFKLTQTKPEVIVLTDAAGNPLDNVPLVPNQIDHSYGRSSDGGASWVVFTNPTIGATNGTTGADLYTETPVFSLPAGNYNGSVTVSITSADPGASIHYTLDGSEPNVGSTLYTGAITINTTSVLRAKSFSSTPNRLPSFIETNTYFIDEIHHIKVMSVCGGDQGGDGVMDLLQDFVGWGSPDPVGHLELFDKDMNLLSEGSGDFNKHGNDSWAYDQRGFDYIARDQYGYNYAVQDTIFNGKDRSKFQRLIVKAAASDNYPFQAGGAHIRDAWCQSLSQTGGLKLDERSYESCVVYVDGQYWGVYEIREKVDDHDFTSYYYDQGRDDIDFIKTWGGTWADYGDMNAWNNDFNFITTNNMAIPANFEYADSVFNWKSLIDYTVLNSYMVCKDMLSWNTAWWHGKDPNGDKKKWRYILWDMDAIYGHYINFTGIPDESMQADPCNIETSPSIDDPEGHMEILNALMVNPEVEQWYISRYIDLANGLFSCDVLLGHLDSLVDIIDPEMQRHVNRWGGSYGGWQANVQAFRDSILIRCSSLNDGLVDCYEVEGPYRVAYNVAPMNTGDVKINSITPSSYPYAGDYFGGIDINLEAIPASGNVFHYWEVINQSDSLSIDSLSNPAIFRIGQVDSVIAHFIEMDTVLLSFNVNPVGAGDIEIDGVIPPSYPHSDYYPLTQQLTLEATPQSGYIFSHWSSDNGTTFSSSATANPATMSVGVADNIVANFIVDESALVFDVAPANGGKIKVDNVSLGSTYPVSSAYANGQASVLEAVPNSGFTFLSWTTSSGAAVLPMADTAIVNITVTQPDTITALFAPDTFEIKFNVDTIGGGDIAINGDIPVSYVFSSEYVAGTTLELEAINSENYLFDHWETLSHTFLPSLTDLEVSFDVGAVDSIVAVFVELPSEGAFVPMAFSPNGDDNNDYLYVYGDQIVTMNIEIYDRWGKKVFFSTDQTMGWDGRFNGKDMNPGVYYYKVSATYQNGNSETKAGDVTLVR